MDARREERKKRVSIETLSRGKKKGRPKTEFFAAESFFAISGFNIKVEKSFKPAAAQRIRKTAALEESAHSTSARKRSA